MYTTDECHTAVIGGAENCVCYSFTWLRSKLGKETPRSFVSPSTSDVTPTTTCSLFTLLVSIPCSNCSQLHNTFHLRAVPARAQASGWVGSSSYNLFCIPVTKTLTLTAGSALWKHCRWRRACNFIKNHTNCSFPTSAKLELKTHQLLHIQMLWILHIKEGHFKSFKLVTNTLLWHKCCHCLVWKTLQNYDTELYIQRLNIKTSRTLGSL